MTASVRQVLDEKGSRVHAVPPGASVYEALELMAQHDIGAVVVAEGECLAGIFTERDYARKVILQGRTSRDTRVGELMTPNVLTVSPSQTMDDCMQLMTENRVRHLPVVERGRLVGIVTIGDAVKTVIAEHEATIRQLSSYIAGDLAS
ncbi:MAG: CBS domain-containing protein [Gammaproteobacteria bacterium]|jgi:CBS domain-containing protein|nr:CBS domain-containing protein [Gammaproteobacteria bacterium]